MSHSQQVRHKSAMPQERADHCLYLSTPPLTLLPPCTTPHHHLPTESEAYEISLSKLNKLLEDRTKYYENADVTVDLKGYGKDEAAGAPTAGAAGLVVGCCR